MEHIGQIVSKEDGQLLMRQPATQTREVTPKELLGEAYPPFRELMHRLSSEYNWEMTGKDGMNWGQAAHSLGFELFAQSVVAYLADTSTTSDGTPHCTFRPRIGQILAHADRITKLHKTREQSEKTSQMMREDKASSETVARCMGEIREQSWYRRVRRTAK